MHQAKLPLEAATADSLHMQHERWIFSMYFAEVSLFEILNDLPAKPRPLCSALTSDLPFD